MCEIPCPIAALARTDPERVAIIQDQQALTYAQLHNAIEHAAAQLTVNGIRHGDRIALVESNSLEAIIALFALFRMGGIATLLPVRYPESLLREVCKLCGCKSQLLADISKQAGITGLPTISINTFVADSNPRVAKDAQYSGQATATIMFTSGSSGPPKGVVHIFDNHFYNAIASNQNIAITRNDRWLLSLPIYHVGGIAILFRTFFAGGTVVVADPGEDLAAKIAKHAITHVSVVSTQLRTLLSSAKTGEGPSSLKAVLVGGGPVGDLPDQARAAGLPVCTTYGLTEMASQVATSGPGDSKTRVLPYCELKISIESEILVRGKTLFAGYVEQRGVNLPVDADGWFATGDYGAMEGIGAEECLKVTGRRDNMFVSGGENVHPQQIESALSKLDAVSEAIVVPVCDSKYGHLSAAFIKGTDASVDLMSASQLKTALIEKSQLPAFMIPRYVFAWPKDYSPIGLKPNRDWLRRHAEELLIAQRK